MTAIDILLVEDDENIAKLLRDFLEDKGYSICVADNGDKAIALYDRYSAKLCILDVMLPGKDGFAILSHIRRDSNIPVIIASAKDTKEDKLNGLMGGADDYIEKPYDIDIMLAKIDGIFKRRYAQSAVEAGDITLDMVGKSVMYKGKPVDMTTKEYELMELFMNNKGKALTKEYLFKEVWGSDSESEIQTLTVHIKWLRSKLEKDPKKPEHILTVWGTGYKFV